MMVANITETSLRLYNIPAHRHEEIRDAYEKRQFLWIVRVWNDHEVTSKRLCASCPDSVAVVKEFIPLLWTQ